MSFYYKRVVLVDLQSTPVVAVTPVIFTVGHDLAAELVMGVSESCLLFVTVLVFTLSNKTSAPEE